MIFSYALIATTNKLIIIAKSTRKLEKQCLVWYVVMLIIFTLV